MSKEERKQTLIALYDSTSDEKQTTAPVPDDYSGRSFSLLDLATVSLTIAAAFTDYQDCLL